MLELHDVTVVVASHTPLPEIEVFKRYMGLRSKWMSSYGSNFNYDYQMSFTKDDICERARSPTTTE